MFESIFGPPMYGNYHKDTSACLGMYTAWGFGVRSFLAWALSMTTQARRPIVAIQSGLKELDFCLQNSYDCTGPVKSLSL